MGLDMTVQIQHNFSKDEKGRNTWQVTQLANLHNCWNILDHLGIENCTTQTVYGKHFYNILDELKEDMGGQDEMEYKAEINKLEQFIKENNVQNDESQDYQVHAWF